MSYAYSVRYQQQRLCDGGLRGGGGVEPASVWKIPTPFFSLSVGIQREKISLKKHQNYVIIFAGFCTNLPESRFHFQSGSALQGSGVIERIGFNGQLQVSGKKRGNVVMACCPHSVIKARAAQSSCWCSCFCGSGRQSFTGADPLFMRLAHMP